MCTNLPVKWGHLSQVRALSVLQKVHLHNWKLSGTTILICMLLSCLHVNRLMSIAAYSQQPILFCICKYCPRSAVVIIKSLVETIDQLCLAVILEEHRFWGDVMLCHICINRVNTFVQLIVNLNPQPMQSLVQLCVQISNQ